ncbi:MAG: GspE/PulE family protein [Lachnospiraceae bacterium]
MAVRREKKKLGDILVREQVIKQEQLEQALALARESGKKIGEVLIELGYTSEQAIAKALASQLGLESISLLGLNIPKDIINLVSESILRKHVILPFAYDAMNPNIIKVAMADPMDMNALDDISIITNLWPEPVIATSAQIMAALDKHFGDAQASLAAAEYAKEREDQLARNQDEETNDDINNSPVVQLVRTLIEQAARQRASDIHIEALENMVRIRYRIDGALYEKSSYNIHLLPAIMARIKIIGGMDISEKRKPQDGRITINVDNKEYDIRVSILPTVYGEKCVMRLAQKKALTRKKSELGLSEQEMKLFDQILQNPNGILLVTGPTGSGKSTTLYTALSELNREDVNIITVEDPVEANIDGINQVQVNVKADLTFATALRSILRQDPDIIMIGEIRDSETANIAVQASITGHLVVSTLHTNSAAGTLVRLLEMGIESYLLADAMIGVIAQRLVRKLCDHCKAPRQATEEECKRMGIDSLEPVTVYEHRGCENCDHTGYLGRTGIYEIMVINERLRELISKNSSAEQLKKAAQEIGMKTLRDSAARFVIHGETSFEEMMRITYENE